MVLEAYHVENSIEENTTLDLAVSNARPARLALGPLTGLGRKDLELETIRVVADDMVAMRDARIEGQSQRTESSFRRGDGGPLRGGRVADIVVEAIILGERDCGVPRAAEEQAIAAID